MNLKWKLLIILCSMIAFGTFSCAKSYLGEIEEMQEELEIPCNAATGEGCE